MNIAKLIEIQKKISKKAVFKPFKLNNQYKIAAFDISFNKNIGYGVCIVIDEKMKIIEEKTAKQQISIPYIPTFLAFRELPLLIKLYKNLQNKPDLIFVDGNGLIHPRRCGIAVHLGVLVKKPTIGVAKSYLYGRYEEPENKKFSYSYVFHEEGDILGVALRSKENLKTIFISPGNLIDIESSLSITKGFITKYKIPEPLRIVHNKTQTTNL